MLHKQISPKTARDRETRYLAEPAILTTIILCGSLMIYGILSISNTGKIDIVPILLGLAGVAYTIALYRAIVKSPEQLQKWKWPTVIIDAICIAAGLIFIENQLIPQIIGILIAASIVILWDKFTSYTFLILSIALHMALEKTISTSAFPDWPNDFTLLLLGFIIVETLHRSSKATQHRIQRLESLNEFAQKIVYSLEIDEVLTLVGAAVQNAIPADTYLLGITTEDQKMIKFDLICDDGEYFPPSIISTEGTLSGWVIRNKQSLFIPDMRESVDPEGVKTIVIGKGKDNRAWMGVPMRAEHISGVISVGSYTSNNFDRTDFDLLENLAQQAALAIDNAFHHAQVEAQSRTDSLTGAYNHNYIVSILHREAENSKTESLPLGVIMLDVDYFKQYNDQYGHMVGDQVLIALTQTIRQHIKATDAVGRWGGEEFIIVLPKTSVQQAFTVATHIQQAMSVLLIRDRNGEYLHAPTVSQGVAIYPSDTHEIDRLIDLADQRLYVAKERGRNQVEMGHQDDEQWSI